MWPNRKVIGGMFNPLTLGNPFGPPVQLQDFDLVPNDGTITEDEPGRFRLRAGPVDQKAFISCAVTDMIPGAGYVLSFWWAAESDNLVGVKIGITFDNGEISDFSPAEQGDIADQFEAVESTQYFTFYNTALLQIQVGHIFLQRIY